MRARARHASNPTPDPVSLTGGAVMAWLRNTNVGAISSLADVLSPGNPAVQATGSKQPTGNADGSMTFDGSDTLGWPVTAQNFTTAKWGFSFWFKPSSLGAAAALVSMRVGASIFQLNFSGSLGALQFTVWNPSGQIRDGFTADGAMALNVWKFVSIEYDGSYAAEADKAYLAINGVKQTLTFSGAASAMPAVCQSGGTQMHLGSAGDSSQYINAAVGKNVFSSQGPGGISGGGHYTAAARAALMAYEPPVEYPVLITQGAVTSWLRNTTVGSISSLPDMLNSNPATQATGARQPTGNADGSIRFDGNDALSWPLNASNNGTTQTGFGFWLKAASLSMNHTLVEIGNGATGTKLTFYVDSAGSLIANMFSGNGVGRYMLGSPGEIAVARPRYVTIEFNSAMATEATRMVITSNGVVLPMAYGALGGGSLITALNTVTGNAFIGAGNASGGSGINATLSNFVSFGLAMAGATEGLLTATGRAALQNYEPLS